MLFERYNTFLGHTGPIYALARKNGVLYSAGTDKYVFSWDTNALQRLQFAIKLPSTPFFLLLIDKNSKLVVGLSNGDIHIFDLYENKEIHFFKAHQNGIFSGIERADFQHFYLADGNGTLSVWDTSSMKLLLMLPFHCGKIRQIKLSSDHSQLYLCCQDGKIRVLDTTFFNLIHQFDAHPNGVGTLVEYTDNILVTAGKDAHIRIWDKKNCQLLHSIPAHRYMIYNLLPLSQDHIVSISRDATIKIWNTNTWEVIQRLDLKSSGHRHSVNQLISLNDKQFVTASDDGKIILWSSKKENTDTFN